MWSLKAVAGTKLILKACEYAWEDCAFDALETYLVHHAKVSTG